MKKKIQPWVANIISSPFLLNFKRSVQEIKRVVLRQHHLVSVFIRVDDPYSYLLVQVLPELQRRYRVEFSYHVVSNLQDHMFPEPALWHENALKDSAHIADLYQLEFPTLNEPRCVEETQAVTNQLLALEQQNDFVASALTVLNEYWGGKSVVDTSAQKEMKAHLLANDALLDSLGHYLSGTLHYAGEWYWGVDRLGHLEHRLNALKLNRSADVVKFEESTRYFCRRFKGLDRAIKRPSGPLTIYFSARSPYSFLGLERGVALARYYNIPIVIKPVLPMLMRGVIVPPRKKWYIFSDTKREASKLGLDYGFVADPLGVGVERCYVLFDYAQSNNRAVEYMLAFARAVNTRAIRSDTDAGMKTIVEEAGLDWAIAQPLLAVHAQESCLDDSEERRENNWRHSVMKNYKEMHSEGLWGVPCFKYGDVAVWGQDRIDVIERTICEAIELANIPDN